MGIFMIGYTAASLVVAVGHPLPSKACKAYGAIECRELPNGDLRIESKFRDKHGRQMIDIIKRKDIVR